MCSSYYDESRSTVKKSQGKLSSLESSKRQVSFIYGAEKISSFNWRQCPSKAQIYVTIWVPTILVYDNDPRPSLGSPHIDIYIPLLQRVTYWLHWIPLKQRPANFFQKEPVLEVTYLCTPSQHCSYIYSTKTAIDDMWTG